MKNSEMIANRFANYARYRRMHGAIMTALIAGRTVQVATHLRATRYTAKHAALFSVDRTGVYVRNGKRTDCIHFCTISIFS